MVGNVGQQQQQQQQPVERGPATGQQPLLCSLVSVPVSARQPSHKRTRSTLSSLLAYRVATPPSSTNRTYPLIAATRSVLVVLFAFFLLFEFPLFARVSRWRLMKTVCLYY